MYKLTKTNRIRQFKQQITVVDKLWNVESGGTVADLAKHIEADEKPAREDLHGVH